MLSDYLKISFRRIIKSITPHDKIDALILITSISLFLYTFLVSFLSDITYDEAYTYLKYCQKDGPNFLAIHVANNHPLNSLLVYITSFLFPYSEIAIRLPNLLFLLLYLICSIKLSKLFPSFKLIVFGLLVFYFYLIPFFFSQARGYGISTSLVLLFLVKFNQENQDFKTIIKNLYILLLATFAFTGLFPLVISVAIYYLIFVIKNNILKFLKLYLSDIVLLFISFSYLLYNLIEVSKDGKPLYGSNSSFLDSTLGYYFSSFSELIPELNQKLLILISSIFILLCIVAIIFKRKQAKLCFVTISTFSLFYTFSQISGRPYITGRLLLPLYPLVVLSIIELINYGTKYIKNKKYLLPILSTLLFLLFIVNYLHKSHFRAKFHGNYKSEIFEKLNLRVKHKGCCSSIPFYRKKFVYSPPMEKIKKDKTFTQEKLTDSLNIIYSIEKSYFLIEALPDADITTSFFLHVIPININDLPKRHKQSGFHKLNFKWTEHNKRYMLRELPEYNYSSFTIGQFNKQGKKWEKTITINPVQSMN